MPKNPGLKKVLVIGSGAIVIGQAAEFDYAGTQACRVLKEEGIEVVLVNPNPATIMTDTAIADRVYLEPLTLPSLTQIIAKEHPDGVLATLGGQTGLNMGVALAKAGVLDRYDATLLGTSLDTIVKAEDRKAFRDTMNEIGEPIAPSGVASTVAEAIHLGQEIGFPLILRPAYTLGGTGGGKVESAEDLPSKVAIALSLSPIHQVLVEKSLFGYLEIEYEVLRDHSGRKVVVCGMENLDPVGVHTGDSIVVAPVLTLTDREHQRLRTASLKIVEALGVEGGCNVQYAFHPETREYFVIEVNPRVSRSSALASKATGYPIAKVATKIAIGYGLHEIQNPITKNTTAFFEPTLDYVVMKLPRFPFDKFKEGDRSLGTQMKATGEVMAIDRTFEGALQKALRSLDNGVDGFLWSEAPTWSDAKLRDLLAHPDDRRLFAIAEGFRRGISLAEMQELTAWSLFFLARIERILSLEKEIAAGGTPDFRSWKRLGFSDRRLGQLLQADELTIRARRLQQGIKPVYKMVDTCAAEFEAYTPYYYSTYEDEDEATPTGRDSVVILGSGPIRIGQGIEFDYSAVHAAWGLRERNIESIMVNSNPETVSTDFDTSDRLYFEPLTLEDVLNIVDKEQPLGVFASFGGQTALNLARPLLEAGATILGTSVEAIANAEDRELFRQMTEREGILMPPGATIERVEDGVAVADRLGYPVLVRPSFVLGGQAMRICWQPSDVEKYLQGAPTDAGPILIDRYLPGMELEVDALADGKEVLVAGIMEHVEGAGVHSGDSAALYPAPHLSVAVKEEIVHITKQLALSLNVQGLLNIQFVLYQDQVYVIEANPRASRTVPFLAKANGCPLATLAAAVMLGKTLDDLQVQPGLWPEPSVFAAKAPVFSFGKLPGVSPVLGPEMKSTGEVLGFGQTWQEALAKALIAAKLPVAEPGQVGVLPGAEELVPELMAAGYEVLTGSEVLTAINESALVLLVAYSYEDERVARAIRFGIPVLTHKDSVRGLVAARQALPSGLTKPMVLTQKGVHFVTP